MRTQGLMQIAVSLVTSVILLGAADASGPVSSPKSKPSDLVRVKVTHDRLTYTFPQSKSRPHFISPSFSDNQSYFDSYTGDLVEQVTTDRKKLIESLADDSIAQLGLAQILKNVNASKPQLEAELKRSTAYDQDIGVRFDIEMQRSSLGRNQFEIHVFLIDLSTGIEVASIQDNICTTCQTTGAIDSWARAVMHRTEVKITETNASFAKQRKEQIAAEEIISSLDRINRVPVKVSSAGAVSKNAAHQDLHEITIQAKKLPSYVYVYPFHPPLENVEVTGKRIR